MSALLGSKVVLLTLVWANVWGRPPVDEPHIRPHRTTYRDHGMRDAG